MMSEKLIRRAFELYKAGSMKAKVDSAIWIQMVVSAGLLGWVLEDSGYVDSVEEVLKELVSVVGEPVTG